MNEEPSSSKITPVKAFKRDVKGLLSLHSDSPSQSDVIWDAIDSPLKTRAVGGKAKSSLKSSNQLTPKNNIARKKYYSSPILVARSSSDDGKKEELTDEKDSESRRILEEFQRQFNENYVPRNLLDNLSESLEDSIIIPDAEINTNINNKNTQKNEMDIDDEFVDLDILREIEEQEKMLSDQTYKDIGIKSTNSSTESVKKSLAPTILMTNQVSTSSSTKKVTFGYFDSDDDDDLILSIPIEKLTDESSCSKTAIKSNPKDPPKCNTSINNKILDRNGHTSVIPVKRVHSNVNNDDINRIQNQSNLKPVAHQSNAGSIGAHAQEPSAKRVCTSEEIAEKKRQAMMRREAYLRSLKAAQKTKMV